MTKAGTRLIAALAAVVLAVGLLASCGDSDSSDNGSPSSSGTASQGSAGSPGQGGPDSSRGEGSQAGGGEGKAAQPERSGDEAAVTTPLRVSGGGSDQFRAQGGDNSIQDFGEESDESELQAAAEAVHGFYVARAEEDWARACSYLAKSMVEQLEQLAEREPRLKGKGCAEVLRAFTPPLPASVRRETTVVDAGSLRREGERGFLIYYGEDGTAYAIGLEDEGGVWKLTLISATPLG